MKIVICASIEFTPTIKEVADALTVRGDEVEIPLSSQRIINGDFTLEEFLNKKEQESDADQKIQDNVIKRYFNKIKEADAILVINREKRGIPNYIGGNTFLEMAFAHVLDKPIYLYNDMPDMPYTSELTAMQPIVIHRDVSKIQ